MDVSTLTEDETLHASKELPKGNTLDPCFTAPEELNDMSTQERFTCNRSFHGRALEDLLSLNFVRGLPDFPRWHIKVASAPWQWITLRAAHVVFQFVFLILRIQTIWPIC